MNSKSLFASKTFWINAIAILAGILNEVAPVIQDTTLSRSAVIYAIIMIILRKITKDPVHVRRSKDS